MVVGWWLDHTGRRLQKRCNLKVASMKSCLQCRAFPISSSSSVDISLGVEKCLNKLKVTASSGCLQCRRSFRLSCSSINISLSIKLITGQISSSIFWDTSYRRLMTWLAATSCKIQLKICGNSSSPIDIDGSCERNELLLERLRYDLKWFELLVVRWNWYTGGRTPETYRIVIWSGC